MYNNKYHVVERTPIDYLKYNFKNEILNRVINIF